VVKTSDNTKQIALVTGASRGIGRAIAVALAESGRFVYINYASNKEAAKQTLKEIKKKNGEGKLLGFDVTDKEKSEKAITQILKEKGQIDILVNNAGIRDDMLMVWMKKKKLAECT